MKNIPVNAGEIKPGRNPRKPRRNPRRANPLSNHGTTSGTVVKDGTDKDGTDKDGTTVLKEDKIFQCITDCQIGSTFLERVNMLPRIRR